MRDLVAHHVSLLKNFRRERVGGMRRSLVENDRQRRLDRMRKISHMRARALDDFPVGVDQRVGLARQGSDLNRKFAFKPLGPPGADVSDRF